MKITSSIHATIIAVLVIGTSAFTSRPAAGKEAPHEAGHLGGAFRDDATLRFMRRLRAPQHGVPAAPEGQATEAFRSKICAHHGFKALDRAGCVAFMRQACGTGVVQKAAAADDSCQFFFQQEHLQPGFGAAKETRLTAKEKQDPFKEVGKAFKDAQKGPKHDSKKAQKAADKVADKHPPAEAPGTPLADSLKDGLKDAQRGPHYKSAAKPDKSASEPAERPEEKEVLSVPGCKNSPKGWTDTNGKDCEDYAEGEWCTRHGGYGDAWLDEWGTFEDVATKGKSAKEVCCVCGGGLHKKEEDDETSSGTVPGRRPSAAAEPAGAPVPAVTGPILGSKSGRALQEQGYSGELVYHDDGKTMTEDWGLEFGPHAGHRDIQAICDDHPNNEWCSLHGYYDKKSAADARAPLAAAAAALLFACLH